MKETRRVRIKNALSRLGFVGAWGLSAARRLKAARMRSKFNLRLPADKVEKILLESNAPDWFLWSISHRFDRGEVIAAMSWITANIGCNARIFETGCGCAANLIWLGGRGFNNLAGSDIIREAIDAGQKLAVLAGLSITLCQDDCLASRQPVPRIDVLLALNWLYYHPDFELGRFLEYYRAALEPGGFVVFDMVDDAFDRMPNSQYMTDDWSLPPERRRLTQYKIRMSGDDVRQTATAAGFDVIAILPGTEMPPRFVTVLKNR